MSDIILDTLAPIIRDRIGAAPYTTRWVQPRELLSPARMDVMAAYLYAKHCKLGVDSLYAKHLYAAHIMAFNGAHEAGSDKAGIDTFLSRFNDLLDSIATDGYNEALGPVPVGLGGVLMDGAHRLAACLAYDKPILALFCDVPTWEYSAHWLWENDWHGVTLPEPYLEAMVTEYIGLVPDAHAVTIFPQARMDRGKYGGSTFPPPGYIAGKTIQLTERGARNLMAIMYPGETWIDQKTALCFPQGSGELRLGFVQGSHEYMADLKTEIRAVSGVGNHSVHITDTPAETLRLAHALLNDNSVDWLNRGERPSRFSGWGALVPGAVVDGSAVLECYGLREARDIDVLRWPDAPESHNAETARYHAWTPSEIVYNPARHFWMGDTKVVTPEVVRAMKERRQEAKDLTDLDLLGKRPDKPVLVNVVYAHLQRPYAEHRGNCSVAWTPEPVEGADVFAYADAMSYRGITGAVDVLLMLEPHTVLPGQYSEDVYAHFDNVFTFVPSISERGGKFQHLYLPAYGQPDATGALREVPTGCFDAGPRRHAIVMVHGNKASSQPGEQYTARREFAEWFAAHGKTPMEVYGRPGFPDLANYHGEAGDKHQVLAQYRFALAMDNTWDPIWSAGYFTREVLDALYCGCIPIVKGCYDIERYLPADCYIDLRQFNDYGELDQYLQEFTPTLEDAYRDAICRWLASGEADRYHAHDTYMRLFALAGSEPAGEWAPGLADRRTTLKTRKGNHEVWSWADLSALQAPPPSPAPTNPGKRILQLRQVKELGGPLPVDFLTALRDEFGCDTFVETGTASGQTARNAAEVFTYVYTVELSETLSPTAPLPANVRTYKGHSAEWLATLARTVGTTMPLIWLDAHWSGTGYARGSENCPLLKELAAIAAWPHKPPVMLMDDMRYCAPPTVPVYPDHPTSGFPSLAEIQAAVKAIDARYEFVLYGDIGMAYLPHEGFDVSEEVRQYQHERLGANLASIVILNHNGGDGLRLCLDSVRAYTPAPYEIIVLDNASTDGSLDYLRQQTDVHLVENAANVGCPVGRAQALPMAKGDWVVLLDNDTIVTPGWLESFERAAWSDSRIGLLGPRSNYVSGPQIVPNVPYRDMPGLLEFAKHWQEDHRGELAPVQRLVGFCLFIRRAVLDKIGNVDASFGRFGFEDDSYCLRAVLAGFGVAIANEIFVHHTGGPQRMGDQMYNEAMQNAARIFRDKFGLPPFPQPVTTADYQMVMRRGFQSERDYIPLGE